MSVGPGRALASLAVPAGLCSGSGQPSSPLIRVCGCYCTHGRMQILHKERGDKVGGRTFTVEKGRGNVHPKCYPSPQNKECGRGVWGYRYHVPGMGASLSTQDPK